MKSLIILTTLLLSSFIYAEQPLAISGRLLDSTDVPIEEMGVSYKIQIKSGTCIAYEEIINKDMSSSKGYFNLSLGQGTISHGASTLNLFGEGNITCKDTSSLVLTKDSQRSFKIAVKKSSESVYTDFSEQSINAVGFAKMSHSLDGIKKEGFAQIVGSVSQAILESLSAAKDSLLSLSNGTSSLFVKPSELISSLAGKQDSLGYVPLNKLNNLSDIASAPAARTSLGLHAVASSGSYSDLINQPSYSTVASSGSYVDLLNKPIIPGLPAPCSGGQYLVVSGSNLICENLLIVDESSVPSLSISKINNLQVSLDSKIAKSDVPTCTTSQTLIKDSVSGLFSCQSIATAILPTGSLITYPGGSCPAGFLKMDGSSINRITYSSLFSAIGTTFGSGDGSTTFNLGSNYPTIQKFTSGSGTYSTKLGTQYIRVRMVGGGAGGSGGDAGRTAGGSGGDTTFGISLLVAGGGQSSGNPVVIGTGGSVSLGTAIGTSIVGGVGGGSQLGNSSIYVTGGSGASTPFGPGGISRGNTGSGAGVAPAANTGAGGGGGTGFTTVGSGVGGASGGYIDAIITSPNSTYPYTVGVAGSAGGGTIAGSIGGSGYIEVTEYPIPGNCIKY